MVDHESTRRTFLAATGVATLTGLGVSTVAGDDTLVTDGTFQIMDGTDAETTVHVTTADADGPTVMVIGGIHGDEDAGYRAASNIAEWNIESGQLVVIPKANVRAIERSARTAGDGVDLNREFPTGRDPTDELATAIWNVVVEYEPSVFVDLHESYKLYDGDATDGVGQAIFRSLDVAAAAKAGEAIRYVNENGVTNDTNDFDIGYFSATDVKPDGLLAHKASRDLDSLGFLVETLSNGPALETRIEWHESLVRQLAEDELFAGDADEPADDETEQPPADDETQQPPEDGSEDVPTDDGDDGDDGDGDDDDGDGDDETAPEEPPNEKPTPMVETTPNKAETLDLSRGETVTFEASASMDADGNIASYEWDLDDDNRYEVTGKTAELTLDECGDYPVTLRVTDDDGAVQETGLTVSTKHE